ncbi:MAG: sulfotransferase family protein [Gemmataceae bacterium]
MKTSRNGRTFEKPYRTWGTRALNFLGRRLRRWGWRRPMTFQGILDSACRYTRLSDWGDERFHEPLRVLVQSLEEEARLSPLGRLFMKLNLRHFAANRLWVRQYVKTYPEALAEPVARPLFVIGLPRTGTTLLYNLLSQDSSRRPLRLWETLQPAPHVEVAASPRDWRRTKARGLAFAINHWGAPQLRSVHPLDADGPEECTTLLLNTFVSPAFSLFGDIPRYVEWLDGRGRELLPWVYEEHRLYLQVLQHQGRRAPWILKSPAHVFALEALLATYPDACVVQTHRDMKQVLPSACSLFAIMQGLYSDDVNCRRLGPELARLLDEFLRERDDKDRQVNPRRVYPVDYRSLIADPINTVRAIYGHFGLEVEQGMEQRMRDWMARNPAGKHGAHQYDLEQFGLTSQEVDQIFSEYQKRFQASPQRVAG